MQWERDGELVGRMGLGLMVTALAPVLFIYTLVFALNTYGNAATDTNHRFR